MALGGLLAGIGVTWVYSKSLSLLGHQNDDDAATQIVLLLLLPFASYLIAEHFGVSGILAAVASGMTISRTQLLRQAPLNMRLRANGVWNMLEFVFNGMVFLMLGLQLPGVIEESIVQAELDPTIETWMLFADITLIYCALLLLRFAWLWLMKLYSRYVQNKRPMLFADYTSRGSGSVPLPAFGAPSRWRAYCPSHCFEQRRAVPVPLSTGVYRHRRDPVFAAVRCDGVTAAAEGHYADRPQRAERGAHRAGDDGAGRD